MVSLWRFSLILFPFATLGVIALVIINASNPPHARAESKGSRVLLSGSGNPVIMQARSDVRVSGPVDFSQGALEESDGLEFFKELAEPAPGWSREMTPDESIARLLTKRVDLTAPLIRQDLRTRVELLKRGPSQTEPRPALAQSARNGFGR